MIWAGSCGPAADSSDASGRAAGGFSNNKRLGSNASNAHPLKSAFLISRARSEAFEKVAAIPRAIPRAGLIPGLFPGLG